MKFNESNFTAYSSFYRLQFDFHFISYSYDKDNRLRRFTADVALQRIWEAGDEGSEDDLSLVALLEQEPTVDFPEGVDDTANSNSVSVERGLPGIIGIEYDPHYCQYGWTAVSVWLDLFSNR